MKLPYQALGRLKSGQMNQTERRYSDRLELLKRAGEIVWYEFEPINLRLGNNLFYSPDFMVLTKDLALQIHEVKGTYVTDDALVKIKAAAAKFPFEFIMYKYKNKTWEETRF